MATKSSVTLIYFNQFSMVVHLEGQVLIHTTTDFVIAKTLHISVIIILGQITRVRTATKRLFKILRILMSIVHVTSQKAMR